MSRLSRLRRSAFTLLLGSVLAGQGVQPAPPAATRLTHRQALQLGLTHLFQARIARELRAELRQAPEVERGAFDWQLNASASTGRTEYGELNPRASGLDTLYLTDTSTTQATRTAGLGLSRLTPWGGSLNLNLVAGSNAYAVQQTNQTLPAGPAATLGYDTLNPYSGNLNLGFTQPLLRGFGRRATEAKLRAALEQAEAADDSFRQRLAGLLTFVDSLYWDLAYARQNLTNKTVALELSRKQLQEDQDRVASGMLAPIELPQVEATVAEREKQLSSAQARVKNAEAALLNNLYPEGDRPATLEGLDAPKAGPEPVSLPEALAAALTHRPELSAGKHELLARKILEAAAENTTLPKLDTQVSIIRGSGTQPEVSGVWNDFNQGRYPGYYVGLTFAYPLGNRAAKARLSQARAAARSAEYQVKDLRTTIDLEVQQAYTDLTTARKEVESTDKALLFRNQSLEAEMTKLENGMSTSFFVLQRQDELDQARSADLESRIAVEKARTHLERAMGTLVAFQPLED